MASKNKDKNRGLFSGLGWFSRGEKSYWWLPFVFLFLFLAAGGFYAWNAMKGAAHKLAGGSSYNALSANSAGYGSFSSVAKEDGFFASDEELFSPPGEKAQRAGLEAVLPQAHANTRAGAAGAAGAAGFERDSENPQGEAPGYQGAGGQSGALQSKLRARHSAPAGTGSGQVSKPTAFTRDEEEKKPGAGAVASAGKTLDGNAPKKSPGTSVMESLKSAFKSSLYGARLASQDAARTWIAKRFTGAPDAELALQYDDKMRAKLDRINPGSIPGFLRDQNLDATNARSLGVSEVSKPEMDRESTKEALKGDKDYQAKKAAQDMASGMLNPMFGGLARGGTQDTPPAGGQPSPNAMSDPDAKQELPLTVDEFGNTTVPGSNGLKYIFGKDGAILGCEDPKAGLCLMPGAGGCPSGLYFT